LPFTGHINTPVALHVFVFDQTHTFSLLRRALTVHDSNLQSRPLFSLIDSFDREALRVGLYSRCHSGAGNNPSSE
jgi:hypothetical protein